MKILVNGQSMNLPDIRTVQEALSHLGYESEHIAVALNMNCVPRRQYAQTALSEGDELEILAPMQGG